MTEGGSKMKQLLLLLVIPVLLNSANMSAKGFVIENSHVYTTLDAKKKCDNNSTISCFSIGIKAGLIDGSQQRANNLGYSVIRGCNGEQSANYCSGYIIGYSRAYGHEPNAIEFYKIVNKMAFDKARAQVAPTPGDITCTTSALFCNTYLHASLCLARSSIDLSTVRVLSRVTIFEYTYDFGT